MPLFDKILGGFAPAKGQQPTAVAVFEEAGDDESGLDSEAGGVETMESLRQDVKVLRRKVGKLVQECRGWQDQVEVHTQVKKDMMDQYVQERDAHVAQQQAVAMLERKLTAVIVENRKLHAEVEEQWKLWSGGHIKGEGASDDAAEQDKLASVRALLDSLSQNELEKQACDWYMEADAAKRLLSTVSEEKKDVEMKYALLKQEKDGMGGVQAPHVGIAPSGKGVDGTTAPAAVDDGRRLKRLILKLRTQLDTVTKQGHVTRTELEAALAAEKEKVQNMMQGANHDAAADVQHYKSMLSDRDAEVLSLDSKVQSLSLMLQEHDTVVQEKDTTIRCLERELQRVRSEMEGAVGQSTSKDEDSAPACGACHTVVKLAFCRTCTVQRAYQVNEWMRELDFLQRCIGSMAEDAVAVEGEITVLFDEVIDVLTDECGKALEECDRLRVAYANARQALDRMACDRGHLLARLTTLTEDVEVRERAGEQFMSIIERITDSESDNREERVSQVAGSIAVLERELYIEKKRPK